MVAVDHHLSIAPILLPAHFLIYQKCEGIVTNEPTAFQCYQAVALTPPSSFTPQIQRSSSVSPPPPPPYRRNSFLR